MTDIQTEKGFLKEMAVMTPLKPLVSVTENKTPKTAFEQSFREYFLVENAELRIQRLQQQALERFEAIGFPTRRNESWKYIQLTPLLNQAFVPFSAANLEKLSSEIKTHFLPEADGARLVFINGQLVSALS